VNVTPDEYERWIDSLNNAEREELKKAGITGMLTEDDINLSHRIQLRGEDGLCVFQKNGVPRVCDSTSETHLVDDEEPMDELRADLAEGLLKVIDWILGEASPKTIFRRPTIIAYRLSILCRVLNIGGFGDCKLADLAREAGLTRAAFSKMAVNFRDCMGSKFLAAKGDREHCRKTSAIRTKESWDERRQSLRSASQYRKQT
jgi:hypothetical protein